MDTNFKNVSRSLLQPWTEPMASPIQPMGPGSQSKDNTLQEEEAMERSESDDCCGGGQEQGGGDNGYGVVDSKSCSEGEPSGSSVKKRKLAAYASLQPAEAETCVTANGLQSEVCDTKDQCWCPCGSARCKGCSARHATAGYASSAPAPWSEAWYARQIAITSGFHETAQDDFYCSSIDESSLCASPGGSQ